MEEVDNFVQRVKILLVNNKDKNVAAAEAATGGVL